MKRLVIASDHHGYALKTFLITQSVVGGTAITWLDVGCNSSTLCDYPLFARTAVQHVLSGQVHGAIMLCGSGVGMSIAANRFPGIYAALVWREEVAARAKHEDNANVLVLPADFVDQGQVLRILQAWVRESFAGGRYQARLDLVDQLKG